MEKRDLQKLPQAEEEERSEEVLIKANEECPDCKGIHVGSDFDCTASPRPHFICLHTQFHTYSRIGRLTDSQGVVTSYSADIKIECKDCKLPFVFLGLPMGSIIGGATCSVDGLEGRFSITPLEKTLEKP